MGFLVIAVTDCEPYRPTYHPTNETMPRVQPPPASASRHPNLLGMPVWLPNLPEQACVFSSKQGSWGAGSLCNRSALTTMEISGNVGTGRFCVTRASVCLRLFTPVLQKRGTCQTRQTRNGGEEGTLLFFSSRLFFISFFLFLFVRSVGTLDSLIIDVPMPATPRHPSRPSSESSSQRHA